MTTHKKCNAYQKCPECLREYLINERKKIKKVIQPMFFNPPYNTIVAWNPMRTHSLEEPFWTAEDDKIIERQLEEQRKLTEYVDKMLDRTIRWNSM